MNRSTLAVALSAVPVVGLVALGWDPRVVVAAYWLELGAVVCRGAAETLFAARPPTGNSPRRPLFELAELRGSVRPIAALPPIYPRTVPTAALAVAALLFVWGGAGAALWLDGALAAAPVALAASAAALVAGQAARLAAYLRDGAYESATPESRLPRGEVLGLLVLLLPLSRLGTGVVVAPTGVAPAFAAVVGVRVVADLWRPSAGPLGPLLDRLTVDGDGADPPPVHIPDGEPTARIRPDRRAVWLGGAAYGVASAFVTPAAVVLAAAVGVAWFAVAPVAAVLAGAVVLAVAALVRAAEYDLRYGRLEYRVYDGRVVAYDRRLGTAQWSASTATVETETGLFGSLRLGGDGSERLVFLDDAESARRRLRATG